MSGLFDALAGVGSAANASPAASLAPRVQTSLEGRPRPIGAGQNRFAGNIIWYGDYKAVATSSGGKGGGGSGGKGNSASQGYNYSASFQISTGEQNTSIQSITNGTQYDFFYAVPPALVTTLQNRGITVTTGNTWGGTFLNGNPAQAAWAYLVSAHPTQALNYRGESLACFPNLNLGSSATLPNFNFEVLWAINSDLPALGPDANPADWLNGFLANDTWGVGFPQVLVSATDIYAENDVYSMPDIFTGFGDYKTWARATGMMISPVLTGQTAANSHLADIMTGTIAEFVWSGGQLKIVPYAEAPVTGNGYTYTPSTAPIYDLDETMLMDVQHGPSTQGESTPLKITRADANQVLNQIPVEFLDRANLYNPVSISDTDDATLITTGRLRADNVRQQHFFCLQAAASISASLQLRRSRYLTTYFFRLAPQFVLLDPMDIVTLTVPKFNLVKKPVRITEIKRNSDGSFAFTAEEYFGAIHPPVFARQTQLGVGRNANQNPGAVIQPIIFEPVDAEGDGLKIWMGVAGADLTIWGGANIWVATTETGQYQQKGTIVGASRMGVLTAGLPTIAAATTGQTIDNTNTLSVSLAESNGALAGGTVTDMLQLAAACYVNGEIISYQNAALTGPNAYNLAPMVRGAYGSPIAAHNIGDPFLRLDDTIFELPYTQDLIGSQIYIKFQSFNIYGGGAQDLSTVGAIPYTIEGTALASPLPDITNLRATYIDNRLGITWDEISDFRTVRYEVRRGASWDTALGLGTVAHPPFPSYGDGTYLVKAVSQPAANLIVYLTDALSIPLVGSVIQENVMATYDDAAAGWPGPISGPGMISGLNFVTTTNGTIAYYESPVIFDVLYDRETQLNLTSSSTGVPVGNDILVDPDVIIDPDILGGVPSALTSSWVEVFSGTDAQGDIYAAADIYALPSIYGGTTGSWTKFAPGNLVGRFFKRRLAILSLDPGVITAATSFASEVDCLTRLDHFTNYAMGAGGANFVFLPDGYTSAPSVPFKQGPTAATPLPHVVPVILNPSQGDYAVVSNLTLAGCTVQCFDKTNTGVARTVNITIEGA